jgi:hypothetical protein
VVRYAVDIDEDGDLDLLAQSGQKAQLFFLNDGGLFREADLGLVYTRSDAYYTYAYFGGHALRPADVDGDGDLDLFGLHHINWDDEFDVVWLSWLRGPDGTFGEPVVSEAPIDSQSSAYDLYPQDLDQDGDLDIVCADESHIPLVFLQDSPGHFTEATAGTGDGRALYSAGHFAGDETADILIVAGGRAALQVNDGRGALGTPEFLPLRPDYGRLSMVAGDLNGDEALDIVALEAESGGTLKVLLSNP